MISITRIAALAATFFAGQVAGLEMAACYDPMHSTAYPLTSSSTYVAADLEAAISDDFALMAKHVTTVRTFYSQFEGVGVAQYASENGVKLYLGVYMTSESWQQDEIDAAVAAVQNYPDAVTAIMVGNENLYTGTTAAEILAIVDEIKTSLGSAADSVKFGTVQRITDWVDSTYSSDCASLASNLDLLGVNIYPFFDNSYDSSNPTALLDAEWTEMAASYDVSKLVLTETGYPTAGSAPTDSPDVVPGLDASITYYEGAAGWTPTAGGDNPIFWFGFFDRRPDDTTQTNEYERHFGWVTYDSETKTTSYPPTVGSSSGSSNSTVTTTSTTASASSAATSYSSGSTSYSTPTTTTATPAATTATPATTTATPTVTAASVASVAGEADDDADDSTSTSASAASATTTNCGARY